MQTKFKIGDKVILDSNKINSPAIDKNAVYIVQHIDYDSKGIDSLLYILEANSGARSFAIFSDYVIKLQINCFPDE